MRDQKFQFRMPEFHQESKTWMQFFREEGTAQRDIVYEKTLKNSEI